MSNKALTCFMKYHPDILKNCRFKIGSPYRFNDPFDSQIRLNDKELDRLSNLFAIEKDRIRYFVKRLQCINILSLSGKFAWDMESSNMWGLYADKGAGIAFEFDYEEFVDVTSMKTLKQFMRNYKSVDNNPKQKQEFILNYVTQEIINSLNANIVAVRECFEEIKKDSSNVICDSPEVMFNISLTADNLKSNINKLIHLLDNSTNLVSIFNIPDSLYEVNYTNDFKNLLDIFERHVQKILNTGDTADLVSQFMSTKNIVWQHEEEYRLLIYDIANEVIAPCNDIANNKDNPNRYIEATKRLDELWAKKDSEYYLTFAKDVKYKAKPVIGTNEKGAKILSSYLVPYLPYPKKVYLGWNFNVETEEFLQIKSFCEQNQNPIPLLKIHKNNTNYEQNMFEYEDYVV